MIEAGNAASTCQLELKTHVEKSLVTTLLNDAALAEAQIANKYGLFSLGNIPSYPENLK